MSKRSTPSTVRDQGRAHGVVLDRREQRVGRVRLRLVREVDPREQVPQQAAGEHDHVDVRRLGRERARLDRHEPERPLGVGRAAAEADEARPRAAAPRGRPRDAGSGRHGSPARSRSARRRAGRRRRRTPCPRSAARRDRSGRRACSPPSNGSPNSKNGPTVCDGVEPGISPPSASPRAPAARCPTGTPSAHSGLVVAGRSARSSARAPAGRAPTGRSGRTRTAGRPGSTSA